jgi:arginyl-tRNA---protein transferase
MYRIDGVLVAMSVLDVLPNCVCSAYFLYDSQWERFSLGKLSVFREVALVKEMHAAGAVDIKWLYLGT